MNLDDLRSAVTALSFVLFIGLWIWAWSRGNKRRFEEAALLPLTGDGIGESPSTTPRSPS